MLDANALALVDKYRFKGVLLDANLMLLLAVGEYARERIATFKRTAAYSHDDYETLFSLVSEFDRRVTTPNILTEVDNLGRQLPAREHEGFANALRRIAGSCIEAQRPFRLLMSLPTYGRLGLSDTLSISLAGECLVVSDDLALYLSIVRGGRDAINFNHIRF